MKPMTLEEVIIELAAELDTSINKVEAFIKDVDAEIESEATDFPIQRYL